MTKHPTPSIFVARLDDLRDIGHNDLANHLEMANERGTLLDEINLQRRTGEMSATASLVLSDLTDDLEDADDAQAEQADWSAPPQLSYDDLQAMADASPVLRAAMKITQAGADRTLAGYINSSTIAPIHPTDISCGSDGKQRILFIGPLWHDDDTVRRRFMAANRMQLDGAVLIPQTPPCESFSATMDEFKAEWAKLMQKNAGALRTPMIQLRPGRECRALKAVSIAGNRTLVRKGGRRG